MKYRGDERVYFVYSSLIIQGSQDRNLEAGADAEAMEGSCSLTCSLWLASYSTKAHQPWCGIIHSRLGLLMLITKDISVRCGGTCL